MNVEHCINCEDAAHEEGFMFGYEQGKADILEELKERNKERREMLDNWFNNFEEIIDFEYNIKIGKFREIGLLNEWIEKQEKIYDDE